MGKLWNWLDGKKRTIALIYWTMWIPAMTLIWPTTIPHKVALWSGLAGLMFSFIGLGHAMYKSKKED